MKDVLDDRRLAISQNIRDDKTYEIARCMLAYGVQSYGETVDIYVLNMPFEHVYVVRSVCSLQVPCQRKGNWNEQIQNLIDRFWNLINININI